MPKIDSDVVAKVVYDRKVSFAAHEVVAGRNNSKCRYQQQYPGYSFHLSFAFDLEPPCGKLEAQ